MAWATVVDRHAGRIEVGGEVVDVAVHGTQAEPHRDHGKMGATCVASGATGMEVLPEGLVLDVVPADGTEHVVVGEEVVKAQVLDSSPNPPDSGRASPKFDLRIGDADLHGLQPATGRPLPSALGLQSKAQPGLLRRVQGDLDGMQFVA